MIQTCTVGSSSTEQWFITRVMSQRRNKVLIEWMARSCKGDMNQTLLTQKTIHGGIEELLLEQLQRPTSNCRSSTAQGNVQDILEWLAPEQFERIRYMFLCVRANEAGLICNHHGDATITFQQVTP